eukprot:10857518-Ditylum_brightwellii.AAC.1
MIRICRTCGAHGDIVVDDDDDDDRNSIPSSKAPKCGCQAHNGGGTDAPPLEGPIWVGPLFDVDTVNSMADMAQSKEAAHLISPQTRDLLHVIQKEATILHRKGEGGGGGR